MLYRQTFPRLRNRGRTYRNAPVTCSRMQQNVFYFHFFSFLFSKKKEKRKKKHKYLRSSFHDSRFVANFYVNCANQLVGLFRLAGRSNTDVCVGIFFTKKTKHGRMERRGGNEMVDRIILDQGFEFRALPAS